MLNKIAISVLYINYNYKKMKLINSPIYTERIRRFTVKGEDVNQRYCAIHQSYYSWSRNSPLPNKKETCHSRKYKSC